MAAVFAILLPVFGIVLAGFVVARLRLLSPVGTRRLGVFVYYVAIPALLFRGTENGLPAGGGGIVLAYFAGALALFVVGMLLARRAFGADGRAGDPWRLRRAGHAVAHPHHRAPLARASHRGDDRHRARPQCRRGGRAHATDRRRRDADQPYHPGRRHRLRLE